MTDLQLLPVVSEKAVMLAESERKYIFLVPKAANRLQVAQAVKNRYQVKTEAVNTTIVKGKPQQTMVKRGRQRIKGQRSDFKKAYVTLAKGEKIELLKESK